MYIRFESTKSPDIVYGIKESREKIYINKLLEELQEIEKKIDDIVIVEVPQNVSEEVKQVLEMKNDEINLEKEQLLDRKKQIEEIINLLKENGYNI